MVVANKEATKQGFLLVKLKSSLRKLKSNQIKLTNEFPNSYNEEFEDTKGVIRIRMSRKNRLS
jgi:hypothetical protein